MAAKMDRDDAFAAWRATLSAEEVLGIYFSKNPHQRAYSVRADDVTGLLVGVLFGPAKLGEWSVLSHLKTACYDELSEWFDENEAECMEMFEPREEGLSAEERNPGLVGRGRT